MVSKAIVNVLNSNWVCEFSANPIYKLGCHSRGYTMFELTLVDYFAEVEIGTFDFQVRGKLRKGMKLTDEDGYTYTVLDVLEVDYKDRYGTVVVNHSLS